MRTFSIFILLLIFMPECLSQGIIDGFMKGKGRSDVALAYSYEHFDTYFAEKDLEITRDIQSISIYAAHGITDWADLIVSIPYVNNTGEANLQDGTGMLRFRLAELKTERFKFSLLGGGGYRLPLSDYETESAFAIGQQAEAVLTRGIISAFHKNGWFVQIQSGYTWRSSPTPDSFPIIVKLGFASTKSYFDVWYHRQQARGGFDYRDGFNQPFSSFGVSYSNVGATYYHPIAPWIGFFIQGAYTLEGRNVGQAIRASAGLTLRFYQFSLVM